MDNQDKLKAEQKGDPSTNYSQTKSYNSGPIPIQPDRSLDDFHKIPLSSNGKITQINTELVGQSQDTQQHVNFAQGVILNIGHLAKGQQVMLLTSQTNSAQLSILANPVTTCAPEATIADVSPAQTSCPTVAETRQIVNSFHSTNNHSHVTGTFHPPHSSSHILARSASLCDTQNSYSQFVLQRSQSQDGGTVFEGPVKPNLSGPQQNENTSTNSTIGYGPGVQVHSEQNIFGDKPHITDTNSCNFHQSNILGTGNLSSSGNEIQIQPLSANTNDASLYQSIYSANSDNTSSIVNSFLNELNTELMSTERNSATHDNKQSFGHLGDSFESLQASLNVIQGTEINLDQLDLMDVPDLEQMCNELNGEQNDLSNSMGLSVGGEKWNSQSKDQVTVSKCDNNRTSSSSACNICHRNICSHSTCPNQVTNNMNNIFSQALIANNSECTHVHPDNSNTTVTNSHSNCAKCGHGALGSRTAHHGHRHGTLGHNVHSGGDSSHPVNAPTDIACITDFSPDWAYTEVN